MDQFTQAAIAFFGKLAVGIPLPFFSFIGSVFDELIAPLPSPFVPITAGTLTYEQGYPLAFLFLVALTGTLGKTISTLFTYWVADKLEDFLTHSKLGKILGADEDEIEKYGRYLDGTRKDSVIMVFLRALPIIPTFPVSVIAGLIKLNLWTFIWTTFAGTYIRFMFYMIVAYEGVRKYSGLLSMIDTTGSLIKVGIVLAACSWGFLFLRKKWDKIMNLIFGSRLGSSGKRLISHKKIKGKE